MAKVSLNKIALIKKVDPITIKINNEDIVVQQYLPYDDKISLVERVLNASLDETNFFSAARLEVCLALEIIQAYTNITLTAAQKENLPKTYDLLVINDIIKSVYEAIPDAEITELQHMTYDNASRITQHMTSFLGVLQSLQQNQQVEEFKLDELLDQLKKSEGMELVKDVLEKIG